MPFPPVREVSHVRVLTIANLAALRGWFDGQIATVDGYTTRGDGGGGDFIWYLGDTTADNGGTVLGTGIGRWKRVYDREVYVDWFGPAKNGTTDDYAALLAAYTAADARGTDVRFGVGSYAIRTTLTMRPSAFVSSFGKVPKIRGFGMGCTTLYNGVNNGAMFDLDSQTSHATFKGLLGAGFKDFTMRKVGSPTACTGFKFRTTYHCPIENVHISGMSAHGIQFTTSVGDLDSSIMPTLRNVRIENCLGWGIKADADDGFNEMSYLLMENVFIQACGTSVVGTPTSGGMIYKGQILSMQNCAFAGGNENVGLYIPGAAGLCANVSLQDVTFENCKKRSLYVTGVNVFKGRNLQFYNNNTFVATNSVEFDGTSSYIGNIDIDGVTIRATSGNSAMTAFKLGGTNAVIDTCRVKHVDWQNYDYTGQTRFDGWKFDTIPLQCRLIFVNNQIVRLTPAAPGVGNAMPLRVVSSLAGNVIESTTGEWVETNIDTNGEGLAPTTTVDGVEVPATLIEGGLIGASTRYNCYLYNSSGTRVIGLSATAPTVDAVSGYWVRTGDVAKLWVGAVTTDASVAPNIRFSHVESADGRLTGSKVYDPGSLADGAGETTTVTVTGATLGDYARATFSLDLQGITLTAWVSAADTVSVRFQNESGGSLDLASGILRAVAEKA